MPVASGGEAVAHDTLQPGRTTLGPYDLLELIGEGGAGKVYRARDRRTDQEVAVKVLSPEMAGSPLALKRFQQEFQLASALDHPNIVRALHHGSSAGTHYLVMELVPGESLGARVERDGPLPEGEAVRLIAQACEGMTYAHSRGMIHRDIKPDNLLVTPDGRLKLADLGLSKQLDAAADLTRTGRGLGTPHFMAPEQFRNAKNANASCDVYSLGATLYQLVTGELPFHGRSPVETFLLKEKGELIPPRALVPALSERTEAAILWAVRPDAKDRPASCQELLGALTGQAEPPGPEPAKRGQGRRARAHARVKLLAVAILAAAAAAVLVQFLLRLL
jgi:serine/threonine protein kinase